jgi:hypothetical protein
MPLLENKNDRWGRPLCRHCAQPILPRDGVALMDDSMVHADCVSRPSSSRAVTSLALSRGFITGRVTGATQQWR